MSLGCGSSRSQSATHLGMIRIATSKIKDPGRLHASQVCARYLHPPFVDLGDFIGALVVLVVAAGVFLADLIGADFLAIVGSSDMK